MDKYQKIALILCFSGMSSAFAFTATATIYSLGSGTGSCGFGSGHRSQYVVALNTGGENCQYQNGKNCGRFVQITYKGKSVTAEVVDRCADASNWCNNIPCHIDMDQATAAAIGRSYGSPNDPVDWNFTSAPNDTYACAYVSTTWGNTWAVALKNTYQGISGVEYANSASGPFQSAQWETGKGNQHSARFKVQATGTEVYIKAQNAEGKPISFAAGKNTQMLTSSVTNCQ